MRLIDADNLKLGLCKECTLYPDKCLKENCDWNSIYHIKIEPTVEAIPIEWLLKKMQDDYDKCNLDTIAVVEIGKLIDDWGKENEGRKNI